MLTVPSVDVVLMRPHRLARIFDVTVAAIAGDFRTEPRGAVLAVVVPKGLGCFARVVLKLVPREIFLGKGVGFAELRGNRRDFDAEFLLTVAPQLLVRGRKSKPVTSHTRGNFLCNEKLCRAEKHRHTDSSQAQAVSECEKNSRQSATRRRDLPRILPPMPTCSPCPEPKGLCPQAANASFNSRRSSPESHR